MYTADGNQIYHAELLRPRIQTVLVKYYCPGVHAYKVCLVFV